jgi:hypothetical protein
MYKGDLLRAHHALDEGDTTKYLQLIVRLYIAAAMRHNYRLYNAKKMLQVHQLSNIIPSNPFTNFQLDHRMEVDELLADDFKMTMAKYHCTFTRGD